MSWFGNLFKSIGSGITKAINSVGKNIPLVGGFIDDLTNGDGTFLGMDSGNAFGKVLDNVVSDKKQQELMEQQHLYDLDMAQKQFEYSEQGAENAYQRGVDFWNMQNAYNDPAAQVERLNAAGLNGAAIVGGQNIAQAGGMTGNVQGKGVTQGNTVNAVAAAEVASRARLNNAQADKLEDENVGASLYRSKFVKEMENLGYTTQINELKAQLEAETYDLTKQQREAALDNLIESTNKLLKDMKLTDEQIELLKQDFALKAIELRYADKMTKAEYDLLVRNSENVLKNGELLDRQLQRVSDNEIIAAIDMILMMIGRVFGGSISYSHTSHSKN